MSLVKDMKYLVSLSLSSANGQILRFVGRKFVPRGMSFVVTVSCNPSLMSLTHQ